MGVLVGGMVRGWRAWCGREQLLNRLLCVRRDAFVGDMLVEYDEGAHVQNSVDVLS